jgi:hypothetical protein
MTARELITQAMQEIGAIAASEVASDADAQAGLTRLNSLLDLWQTERLTIYNLDRVLYSLVVGQSAYTIGAIGTPDFAAAVRPTYIQHVGIIWNSGGIPTEIPIEIISDDQYAALIKTVTSSLPTKLYYNPTFPLGTIYLWPVPTDATVQIALYLPMPLTSVASLTTALVLAPGYAEAIRYNLALRLAPIFGRPLDAVVASMAVESKATIKRANSRTDELRVDPALQSEAGAFNIFTGGM